MLLSSFYLRLAYPGVDNSFLQYNFISKSPGLRILSVISIVLPSPFAYTYLYIHAFVRRWLYSFDSIKFCSSKARILYDDVSPVPIDLPIASTSILLLLASISCHYQLICSRFASLFQLPTAQSPTKILEPKLAIMLWTLFSPPNR